MCKTAIHYCEHKFLIGTDVSEKVGIRTKTTNALNVHKLHRRLKSPKTAAEPYVRASFLQIKRRPKDISNGNVPPVDKDPSLFVRIVTGNDKWGFFIQLAIQDSSGNLEITTISTPAEITLRSL
ncbi:hypothetical protein TNCV_4034971 [Trichonephila clavipes]|nr:hypothetical protein TNCV_4034971 [Trichonephila clavipes]